MRFARLCETLLVAMAAAFTLLSLAAGLAHALPASDWVAQSRTPDTQYSAEGVRARHAVCAGTLALPTLALPAAVGACRRNVAARKHSVRSSSARVLAAARRSRVSTSDCGGQ